MDTEDRQQTDESPQGTEGTQFHWGIGTMVRHPSFGLGRIVGYEGDQYAVQFKGDEVRLVASYFDMEAVSLDGDPELDRIKQAVREVFQDFGWLDPDLEMPSRWRGGRLDMIPGKEDTQSKSVPIETFFKKVIGIREKLRVLEQKINNHSSLSQEEKLELEGYVTRCYGSLTSFNNLFRDEMSQFRGTGGKKSES